MTGAELLASVARRTLKNATLDAATEARLLESLNEVYRDVMSRPGMERLRRATTTFPSVADTATYTVTSASKVNRIWETTNDRRLLELSIDAYRTLEPDTAENTGTPSHFVWMGSPGVSSQDIALWPTPSEAITYTCEILAVVTALTNSSTSPILPLDFHDVLIYGAVSREYERADDERMRVAETRYAKRIGQLQYWLAETATGLQSQPMEHSIFNGGWYPATYR